MMVYDWKIIGHKKQLGQLEEDLQSSNLPQCYLFAGAPHVGKYTLAKRLAQILQCEQQGCEDCTVCLNISKGYHPDTLEISNDGETIKIETVRELIRKISTTTPGKHKILLIKNIERLTPESANALLKVLEEPPSQMIFLLTTNIIEDVLPTILSRVRAVKFIGLHPDEIFGYLKQRYGKETDEKIRQVTDFSFGLPGRAIRFMEDGAAFGMVLALFHKAKNTLQQGTVVEKFSLINEITQEEKLEEEFFDVLLLALRYTMLGAAEEGFSPSNRAEVRKNIDVILQAQEALKLRKRNVNAKLLFEHLMLQT